MEQAGAGGGNNIKSLCFRSLISGVVFVPPSSICTPCCCCCFFPCAGEHVDDDDDDEDDHDILITTVELWSKGFQRTGKISIIET